MRTTLDKLVHMANQIAVELGHQQSDHAAEATRDHLTRFWDPAMRAAIVAHLAAGGAGLDPTARRAIELLAARDVA